MGAVGIIAEYNPIHTGHARQIAETRAALGEDTPVVAVMSGNWVQAGRPACTDKWLRTQLALRGGVDLVLELPTVWAVSSAETFAWGGVSLLRAAGVVTDLSFGSECGDVSALEAVADCLDSPAYTAALWRRLDQGRPFAVCRQEAVEELLGPAAGTLLQGPNNNLGVEYLRALARCGGGLRPMTVRRTGAGHDQTAQAEPYTSATHLRSLMEQGEWGQMERWLLPGEAALLQDSGGARREQAERAVLYRLRTMTAKDWAALPDSAPAEGLPERLVRSAEQATSVEEFYTLAKTKRYTHARLRRLALWAFLGLTAADRPKEPPYLRVLGCNGRGRALLREMKARASVPILTKSAHAKDLTEPGRSLFHLESRCTDLYGLCLPQVPPAGREWTQSPVQEP